MSRHYFISHHLVRGAPAWNPCSEQLTSKPSDARYIWLSPAQPDAQLPDGSDHKARLADIAPAASACRLADGRLAEAAVGFHREGDEEVCRMSAASPCPVLPCCCGALVFCRRSSVGNSREVCDRRVHNRLAVSRASRTSPQASRPEIIVPPASRPGSLRSVGSGVDAASVRWMALEDIMPAPQWPSFPQDCTSWHGCSRHGCTSWLQSSAKV